MSKIISETKWSRQLDFLFVILALLLVGSVVQSCGVVGSVESKLHGKWSGTILPNGGEPVNANMEILKDGHMVMVGAPGVFDLTAVGIWHIDDNGDFCRQIENKSGKLNDEDCFSLEFIGDDTFKMVDSNDGVTIQMVRQGDE